MPGELLLGVAILFYGFGILDLLRLILATGAQFVIGLGYVLSSVLASAPVQATTAGRKNPFGKQ
jgi:hypothetical protein